MDENELVTFICMHNVRPARSDSSGVSGRNSNAGISVGLCQIFSQTIDMNRITFVNKSMLSAVFLVKYFTKLRTRHIRTVGFPNRHSDPSSAEIQRWWGLCTALRWYLGPRLTRKDLVFYQRVWLGNLPAHPTANKTYFWRFLCAAQPSGGGWWVVGGGVVVGQKVKYC